MNLCNINCPPTRIGRLLAATPASFPDTLCFLETNSMKEIYPQSSILPHIPDDITLTQFMLEYQHPLKPARREVPYLIEDNTGRKIGFEEVKNNTRALASVLHSTYSIGENDVVMLSSPNHIEYSTVLWAVLMLGGIVSCSNPQFTTGELGHQLRTAKVTFAVGHSSNIATVLSAARLAGLPSDRVILIDQLNHNEPRIPNVHGLIQAGLKQSLEFQQCILDPGEGKRKVALLSWSSGTTGKPKAVAIPHHSLIANIIQMAAHNQVDEVHSSRGNRGYRPGGVALGVLPFYHVAGLVINLHFSLFSAMSVVVVEKYNFLDMLESIVRYRITHLVYVYVEPSCGRCFEPQHQACPSIGRGFVQASCGQESRSQLRQTLDYRSVPRL
ncbi:hypothetical protein FPV67DRAFT_744283 [Lyophyllum atratum]|nr:hypothetical protein FPV67DRAFT_744283 [Lyophyllum atratum]